jgi:pimeloyl-ACP methyl ester carboxylesterase
METPNVSQVVSPFGVAIAYEVHGAGAPALVFVHGWSCDRSYWKEQVTAFSSRFTVVTIDLGGHGASGDQRSDWTIPAFGRDVAAVVNHLDLNRVILIGHSMGGDVIVEAARILQDRVIGLIWVDVYKQLAKPRSPEKVQAFVSDIGSDFIPKTAAFVRTMFPPSADPALVDWIANDMSSAPPEVALPALRSALSFGRDIPAALLDIGKPVIALNPDYPPTDVDSLQRLGIEVMIMTGIGHFLMLEDPGRFNPLLETAIAKLAH